MYVNIYYLATVFTNENGQNCLQKTSTFWSEALNKKILPIHANSNMDKKNNRKTIKNIYSRTRS